MGTARTPQGRQGPSVQLGAPGVNVMSTLAGDLYGSKNNTSMAAPHAAGVAAAKNGSLYSFKKIDGMWETEIIEEVGDYYFRLQPSIDIAPDGLPAMACFEDRGADRKFAKLER